MNSLPAPRLAEQQAVLTRVEELEADRARLYVRAAAARAELALLWADERSGFAEMELAGTAMVGQVRAARELTDAHRLTAMFPQMTALAAEGLVFVPTLEAVLRATSRCTEQVQSAVDARLAGRLVGMNVTDVRRLARHLVLAVEAEIDPDLTRQREDAARQDARTWISPGDDGMTSIGAVIDAVAGRRWALDFDALVRAQRTLDQREGRDRTLQEIQVEVFSALPSLVLELLRAAHAGRLTELAEHTEVDAEAASDLTDLLTELTAPTDGGTTDAGSSDDAATPASKSLVVGTDRHPLTNDGPVDAPPARCLDTMTGEIRVEADPFDAVADEICSRDHTTELPTPADSEEPTEPDTPEPPPRAWAAHDAADSDIPYSQHDTSTGPSLQVLISRCLRMPLPNPTVLNLHLPMATALDMSTAPGVLEGHGALTSRRIRQLLPTAQLREIYVDQTSGTPLGIGPLERRRPGQADLLDLLKRLRPVTLTDDAEPQHDPSAELARFVKLRDQVCPGVGCTMPASRCDLDHELEFPEGETAEWNLGDKSRRCHGAKHHGWTATRHTDGTTEWVSPTGQTYRSQSAWQPPPKVQRPFNVTFHELAMEIDLV